jgi:uncharacterized membrane protein YkoI
MKVLVTVLALLALPMALALAQGAQKPISEIIAALEADGYTIEEVDRDDGHWEIEARDRNGSEVEIKVDPATGEIIEIDD